MLLQGLLMLVIAVLMSIAISIPVALLALISPGSFQADQPPEAFVSKIDLLLALSIIVALPAVTLSVWVARRWLDRRSFGSLGLGRDDFAWRDLIAGIFIPAPLFGSAYLVFWGLGWLEFTGWGWSEGGLALTLVGLILGLLAFFAVGFYEELLFRGYYLHNLIAGTNLAVALFLSSILFALAHLGNLSASVASTIGILAAGYFLAYGWLRTRALWLPIGLHIGWNFFQGPVFGFAVSGTTTPSILIHTIEGPELVTGGGFGPEAGLLVLPMMAIGAALIWLYTRNRTLGQDSMP